MGFFSSVSRGISRSVRRARRQARRVASAPKRIAGAVTGGGNLSERIGNVHSEVVSSTPGGSYIEPALGVVMPATPFVKAFGEEHGVDWPPASKEDKRRHRRKEGRARRRRRRQNPERTAQIARTPVGPAGSVATAAAPLAGDVDTQLEVEEESRFLEIARLFGMGDFPDPRPPPPPEDPPGLLTRLFEAFF